MGKSTNRATLPGVKDRGVHLRRDLIAQADAMLEAAGFLKPKPAIKVKVPKVRRPVADEPIEAAVIYAEPVRPIDPTKAADLVRRPWVSR